MGSSLDFMDTFPSPRCSRFGLRAYTPVVMLTSIIQKVYIDNLCVAQQYIELSKKGSWKKEITNEALKYWNLELIIDADQQGKYTPDELRLEDLLMKRQGGVVTMQKMQRMVTLID